VGQGRSDASENTGLSAAISPSLGRLPPPASCPEELVQPLMLQLEMEGADGPAGPDSSQIAQEVWAEHMAGASSRTHQ
jgi:hypothetical protein